MNSITPAPMLPPDGTLLNGRRLPLLPHHHQMLRESGLLDETVYRGLFSSEQDGALIAALLGTTRAYPASRLPALCLPNFGLDGKANGYYFRPDRPRLDARGRPVKYEAPRTAARLYFPPLFWSWDWNDSTRAVLLTEGIKKSLAVAQLGVLAVAAPGVSLWHKVSHREKTGEWVLNSDLPPLLQEGRRVYIAFDGGDTTTNEGVIRAEWRLFSMLVEYGVDVRLVRVPFEPSGAKVGIDDYLARFPPQDRVRALDDLLATSVPAPRDTPTKEAVRLVRAYGSRGCWPGALSNAWRVLEALLSLADLTNRFEVGTNHRSLASSAGVSRGVVAKAVDRLTEIGWVSRLSREEADDLRLSDGHNSILLRIAGQTWAMSQLAPTADRDGAPLPSEVTESWTDGRREETYSVGRPPTHFVYSPLGTTTFGSPEVASSETTEGKAASSSAQEGSSSSSPSVHDSVTRSGSANLSDFLTHDVWTGAWGTTKRELFRLLLRKELSVKALTVATHRGQGTVYGHLRELGDHGIVRSTRHGRWTAVEDLAVLDAAARRRGTAGTTERRREKIQEERERFRGG